MFHVLSFTIFAAVLVSALPIPSPAQPAGWATGYLEPYETYHSRYLAIGCETQHGKPFFDLCCHPLLATEKLETDRPPQCNPSAGPVDKTSSDTSPADSAPAPSDSPVDQPAVAAAANPTVVDPGSADPPSPPPPSDDKPPASSTTSRKASPSPPPKDDKTPHAPPLPPSPQGAVHASSGSSDLISGGFATFFFQNGVAGACGTVHRDSDLVAAMDSRRYGNTGVHSPLCGKQVKITNPANGKSVTVIVADACPTCNNANSIDLSTGAFNQIASPSQGIVPVQWTFV